MSMYHFAVNKLHNPLRKKTLNAHQASKGYITYLLKDIYNFTNIMLLPVVLLLQTLTLLCEHACISLPSACTLPPSLKEIHD